MHIMIRKVPGSSDLHVLVDGERWATGEKTPRGPHGYSYEFCDTAGRTVRHAKLGYAWRVWSDKQAARYAGISVYSSEQIKPFGVRLPEAINEMIKAGALLSPAQCRAEVAAGRKKQEEAERQMAAEKAELFGSKARETLAKMTGYVKTGLGHTQVPHDEDVTAIVELMKWAQTQ